MLIESFTLIEHIAFDCVPGGDMIEVTARTETDCAFRDGNRWVFNDSTLARRQTYDSSEEFSDFYTFEEYVAHFTQSSQCYHAFSNGVAFGS